jgi:hypothetical protein
MTCEKFSDLLGKSMQEVEQSTLINSFPSVHEVEIIEGGIHWSYPNCGVNLHFSPEAILRSIFFDYTVAPNESATGIRSDATRSEIIAMRGMPSMSKSAQSLPILGKKGAWDRWDTEGYSLHVEYAIEEDFVTMVTLMHPSAVPRKR